MKMGCTSSTEYKIDPVTGKEKKKKKFGGAYPGQRRQQHKPYTPGADQFGSDGKATAHFMAYGGGNALTLVQQDGSHQPQSGGGINGAPEFIQVTLPDGVQAGQTIHVQAPDGRLNAIVVPPGFGPGSTFTVEFAPESQASPQSKPNQSYQSASYPQQQQQPYQPYESSYQPDYSSSQQQPHSQQQPYAPPTYNPTGDDGFASGFNNPHYVPPSAPAHVVNDPYSSNGYDNTYPYTTATPVYNNPSNRY